MARGLAKWMLDSLSNVLTGLGAGARTQSRWTLNVRNQAEIEAAYRTSWLARKIHDLPPYDMTRAWRTWQADKKEITALEAEERRLAVRPKVKRALTLARLHGGGALILGLPGNPNDPVEPESLGKGSLQYVHALSRYQVTIGELRRDPFDPFFGQPVAYTINAGSDRAGATLHPSRVVPFHGAEVPAGALGVTVDDFWGDPLMMSLNAAIDNCERAQIAIADLLQEAKVDVISIPNLMEMVGTAEYEQRLLKRLTLAQGIKSITNALLISGPAGDGDQGEKWETRELRLEGMPDLARMFLQVAAGAADVPATRLLNQSPDGLNATGESDLRNYYDMIAARQTSDMQPGLDPLDEVVIRSAIGERPEELFYEWAPLWQLTPEARATVAKAKAEATKIYSDTGLVPTRALEEGVQNQLIEDGIYPGLETALDELPEDERFPSESEPEVDPALEVMPPEPGALPQRRRAANDQRFADARPRTLYVRRDVLNAAAIIAHFKAQGFETTVPADELHVTIAYSRTPVDWMTIAAEWAREPNGNLTIAAGGPRLVERLGDKGAAVLMFNSPDLSWRHQEIRRAGASWDYETFQPHVTISYEAEGIGLDSVDPWRGVIELGPEIFAEVESEWSEELQEA